MRVRLKTVDLDEMVTVWLSIVCAKCANRQRPIAALMTMFTEFNSDQLPNNR